MSYQNGKIYKLWSPSKNLVYYGSTIQSLSKRLIAHLTKYKCNNVKCASYLVLDCKDYKIELVEEYPCNNRKELCKKEGEYIKSNDCVNINMTGRTKKEYREEHKQEGIEWRKKYREEHKDELKEQYKIYSKTEQGKKNGNARQRKYYQTKKQNNAIYKWLTTTGLVH